jgi:hypothetical protein
MNKIVEAEKLRRQRISDALKGVAKTDKCKENMSKASKGVPKSDAHKAAISAAIKEKWKQVKAAMEAAE